MHRQVWSAVVLVALAVSLRAQMSVGPWTPLFQGIDHAQGTNWPNGSTPISSRQSVHCLRVDLSDPTIRFFTTPPASPYVAEQRETVSLSVSNFLKIYGVQVAIDASVTNPGAATFYRLGSQPDQRWLTALLGLQADFRARSKVRPRPQPPLGGPAAGRTGEPLARPERLSAPVRFANLKINVSYTRLKCGT